MVAYKGFSFLKPKLQIYFLSPALFFQILDKHAIMDFETAEVSQQEFASYQI